LKTLMLILMPLYFFSGCTQKNPPKPITLYKSMPVAKLKYWQHKVAIPAKAQIDAPITIKEAYSLPEKDRARYVAVNATQLVNASKKSQELRNTIKKALGGLSFYEYQVRVFNKLYTKNIRH